LGDLLSQRSGRIDVHVTELLQYFKDIVAGLQDYDRSSRGHMKQHTNPGIRTNQYQMGLCLLEME
jgi:hypothetical protein